VLKRPAKGWGDINDLSNLMSENRIAHFESTKKLFKSGVMTAEQAGIKFVEDVAKDTAAWIGAKYERIKR
jgi:hypothetical protein